jgi:integrase
VLEAKTPASSRDSSQPPSRDVPKTRQQRRAEAREKAKELARKDGQRRKAGGQDGHPGVGRELLVQAHRVPRRRRSRVRSPADGLAARPIQAQQALQGRLPRRRRARGQVSRPAPHLRHTPRGVRTTDANDPGLLGHADSKTTQIYAHYAPSEHEVRMVTEAFAPDAEIRPVTQGTVGDR